MSATGVAWQQVARHGNPKNRSLHTTVTAFFIIITDDAMSDSADLQLDNLWHVWSPYGYAQGR